MKDKNLQTSLYKKLDSLMKKALAAEKEPGIISDVMTEPEVERMIPIREVDEVDTLAEVKLKKRLTAGSIHRQAVQEILKGINEGHFLINVVAPEYSQHKDLVDLIVSSALQGYYQLAQSPVVDENLTPERKTTEERRRRIDRSNKVDNSIVSDIDVSDILERAKEERKRARATPGGQAKSISEIAGDIVEESFFGSKNFDPKDRTNCCYEYIRDYLTNPFPTETGEDASNARTMERDYGNRNVPSYSISGFESRNVNFSTPEEERRHKMVLKNPSGIDSRFEMQPGPFRGLYFDERGNMPLKFDPSNAKSYMFPFLSEANLQREDAEVDSAKTRYFLMMDNAMRASETLRTKWMLFTRLIAAIQGTRPVSVFHASGFDERGNLYTLPDADEVELPEIPEQAINSIVEDFLRTVGMEEITEEVSGALREEVKGQPTPSAPPTFRRRNQRELSVLPQKEQISYLAEEFLNDVSLGRASLENLSQATVSSWIKRRENRLPSTFTLAPAVYNILRTRSKGGSQARSFSKSKFVKTSKISLDGISSKKYVNKIAYAAGTELPVSSIEDAYLLKEWISNCFGAEHSSLWPKVKNKLKSVSKNFKEVDNGFIKEATISPLLTNSGFFQSLRGILDNSPKIDKSRISNITAEYLVDLFIKYLQRKSEEPDVVDYSTESRRGVVGTNNISTGMNASISIPFGSQEQERLGIASEEDFDRVLRRGTAITIISDDNRKESFQLVSARVRDTEGEEIDYSPNGPICQLSLNNPPSRTFSKGKYSILIGGDFSVRGLKAAMYDQLYGASTRTEGQLPTSAVENLHKANGVSLNLSVYPSWVPSPFDFREYSEKGYGHPNNAYNVNKALQQRLKLRAKYERRKVYDSNYRICIGHALDLLNQEIGEMKLVLFKDSPLRYNMDVSRIQSERDPYGSMTEGKGEADVEKNYDFFYEISRRCKAAGIDIGRFSPSFDSNIIVNLLPPGDRDRFLQIRQRVLEEWQNSKRFFILRNLEIGATSSTTGEGNGFLVPTIGGPSQEDNENPEGGGGRNSGIIATDWSEDFKALVQNLYSKFSSQGSVVDPKKSRNHLIVISEEEVQKLIVDPYYVNIVTNFITEEEIEAFFKHYENVEVQDYIQESRLEDDIRDPGYTEEERSLFRKDLERVQSFSTPISFVRNVQDQLSGLSFDEIDSFIRDVVNKIFTSYINSEQKLTVTEVLDTQVREWKDKMEELKREDPRLRNLNIRSEKPNVTFKSYVTEFGSEWQSHVNSKIGRRIARIQKNNNLLNFYRRMLDTKTYLGTVKVKKDNERNVISFKYLTGQVNNLWFDGSTKSEQITPTSIGNEMKSYSDRAGYSMVEEDVYSYLTRNKITNAVKDLSSIVEYETQLRNQISKIEAQTKDLKCSYPVSIVLEGDPGTGKSIFGEVLASALDCKFYSTTLDTIVYAGQSQFRGVSEQNITKFLDCLRGLSNTVLLIDEMDKFLDPSGLSGSGDDVKKALGKFQKAWEDTKDFAIYQEHNLHLIFTTNFWERIKNGKDTQAFANRIGPRGRQFNVPLPASFDTLLDFFQGESVINNLLNAKCGGDATITYYAKQVIENYDSQDPKKQELVKKYINILLKKNKDFFTLSSLLLPNSAEISLAEKNGLRSKDASRIEDFVRGWKMIKSLIVETNKEQAITVGGQRKVIKPLELICHKLEEKMRFTAERLGLSKNYPRTSMREMMNVMKSMFESHQNFMSGEEDLPFNWKTFYISVCQTVFKGAIDETIMTPEDRANPMFERERSQPSENGWSSLKDWVYSRSLTKDQRIPIQALLTEKQFRDFARQTKQQIEEYPIERNGDGGASHFMEQLSVAFYFKNAIFEGNFRKTIEALNARIKEKAKEERGGAEISGVEKTFLDFLGKYSNFRQAIYASFLNYNSTDDQGRKINIFERVRYVCEKQVAPMIDVIKTMDRPISALLNELPEFCTDTYDKIGECREFLSRDLNSVDSHEVAQIPIDKSYKNWDAYRQRASSLLTNPGNEGLSHWSSVIVEQGIKGGEMSQEAYDIIYGVQTQAQKADLTQFKVTQDLESPELDKDIKDYKEKKKLLREPSTEVEIPGATPGTVPSGQIPPSSTPPTAPVAVPGVPPTIPTAQPAAGAGSSTEDITRDIQGLDIFPKKEKKKKKEENEENKGGKAAATTDYYYKIAQGFLTDQTAPTMPSATMPQPQPQLQPQQNQSVGDDGFVVSNDQLLENIGKAIRKIMELRYGSHGVPMLREEDEFSQFITIHKKKS